ncbi:hypothetical protein C8T65DRAFT_587817 [Cerioporus squamosus]|nr:hypothetical protein C8T65DRAFT_587817 [Cerioporus squamosus]
MADSVDIAAAWHLLEITGIVQSVLCGLFGIYFSLFILALWANYGRNDPSSRRLRVVTIVLFVNLSAHFIARSLQFARSRIMEPSSNEFFKWGIPLIVIGNVTTTFAGLCSDGLLAWRFYILFERKRWALYIPGTFVIINAFLCWSADAQHLAAYTHYDFYENTLLPVTLKITVAWGWLMFVINTILTGAIITKIFIASRFRTTSNRYDTIIRACIESALVTWVGLLLYEICSLAPNGHVVTNYDVGYVMASVIPVFFGISQCLIVVRIALTNEFGSQKRLQSQSGLSSHLSDGSRTIGLPSSRYSMAAPKFAETYSDEHVLEVLPHGRGHVMSV